MLDLPSVVPIRFYQNPFHSVLLVFAMRVTNLQKIQDKVLGDYGYGAFGIPFGKKIEDRVCMLLVLSGLD